MMVPPSCGTMANMQRLKSLVCFYHESGPNLSRAGGCAYVRFWLKADIGLTGLWSLHAKASPSPESAPRRLLQAGPPAPRTFSPSPGGQILLLGVSRPRIC